MNARYRQPAVTEALKVWALAFAAIVTTYVFRPDFAKLMATFGFLYLPIWAMKKRGEDFDDYGVTLRRWRDDLKAFALMSLWVIPAFALSFAGFLAVLEVLPPWLRGLLSPYSGHASFQLRLPTRFPEWVVDQLLVVALPEEFFYRGFMQTRLTDAFPQGWRFLGVRIGPAFLLTAALFALGHLAIFQFWRLGVFFPALLFGWLREKTGTVLGSTLFHATCNLTILVLEASYFGPR